MPLFENLTVSAFFLCLGIVGAVFFVFKIVLMLIGLDNSAADGMDVSHGDGLDADHGDANDHMDQDLKLLSIQGIAGAVMMLGFTGYAFAKSDIVGLPLTIVFSLVAAFLSLWLIAFLFRLMLSLESSGNVNLDTASGKEATVYLTIPPGGTGKVQVVVGGRMQVIDAVADTKEEIKTGERVIVFYSEDGTTLTVHKNKDDLSDLGSGSAE
ncbi:MAG: hypothetical protein ACLFQ6_12210 [Candidatus Sumerlaeia bacterium]